MFHYIIQTIAFQLLFLIIYDLFLKRETFFNWNRTYLLLTPMLSFIIPLVKISLFRKVIPQDYVINLPEVFIGDAAPVAIPVTDLSPVMVEASNVSWWNVLFFTGMAVVAVVFAFKIVGLVKLILKNPKLKKEKFIIVRLLNSTSAFSFFNYIFLGEEIQTKEKEIILKHELVHVKQKHSLDLLFFEGLKIVFWFNPLIYIYQRNVQILHEFIADAEALKYHDKTQYYQNLLSQVFETKSMSFINPFFKQSLIKKRIAMLQKSKSKQIKLLKYTLLIPILFGMLIYSSCNELDEQTTVEIELSDEKLKQQLKDEYDAIINSVINKLEVYKAFTPKSKNYILTREEYYRQTILIEKLSREFVKNNEDGRKYNQKTYTEYLEFKKTDEAKELWENKTYDGVLKLVVDDMDNLTLKEKEKRDKKIQLLLNDDHFTKLIQTDGYITVVLGETERKERYNREEGKFVQAIDVPFGVIEQVPTFPECDSGTNEERKRCTSQNIAKFINHNFNTKLASDLNLKGRQRINVIFKISPDGSIDGVRARAPHPILEKEAKRVVQMLPKFVPGKHKGEKVNVPYSLPIIFQVADKK